MRVLIDTNILIHRENHKILSENLQKLMEILHVAGISLLIHPISEEELQKDKDIDRKNIVLSKLRAYPKLKSPLNPKDDKNYLASVGSPTKINDELKLEIKELIIESLELPDVTPDEMQDNIPLFGEESNLGLDSVDALEIVMALQEKYGVRIDDKNQSRFILESINTIAEYVSKEKSK